jgi:hypothetical protein
LHKDKPIELNWDLNKRRDDGKCAKFIYVVISINRYLEPYFSLERKMPRKCLEKC